MNRLCTVLIFAVLLIPSACTTYSGLKPLYPDVGHPHYHVIQVQDLEPVLKWQASSNPNAMYDLIVYEGPEWSSDSLPLPWQQDMKINKVYFRKMLKNQEHKIEEPLKPGLVYFWSIRAIENENIGEWSKYSYRLFTVITYYSETDQLFRFRTPREPAAGQIK
jgi:hypothetical protein